MATNKTQPSTASRPRRRQPLPSLQKVLCGGHSGGRHLGVFIMDPTMHQYSTAESSFRIGPHGWIGGVIFSHVALLPVEVEVTSIAHRTSCWFWATEALHQLWVEQLFSRRRPTVCRL
ncbi:hypothetical protein ACJJTC_007590 [Scirpophaga incertulas]